MDRVIVTKAMVGLCYMQVCAEPDATDEEILSVCNSQNPSGTTNGWMEVIRESNGDYPDDARPVTCRDNPERKHFLIVC